jgi:hypothetical protein
LVYCALSKAAERELVPQEKLKPLIDFLLTNIHKFRIILDCKDSYAIDIPKKGEEYGSRKQLTKMNSDMTQFSRPTGS